MKSHCLSVILLGAFAATAASVTEAQACNGYPGGYGAGYGYFPGFGVPDCISVRTPPYFAIHPPVYYSTRYARPYGISPFAAPPMVHVPDSYKARLEAEFVDPPLTNPYCCSSAVIDAQEVVAADDFAVGPLRLNPFAQPVAQVAQRD